MTRPKVKVRSDAQGKSFFYKDPQPSQGRVAQIYFPTLGTELDDNDKQVLDQVFVHYEMKILVQRIKFVVIGTADWRQADNERLAQDRARAVRAYLDKKFEKMDPDYYKCIDIGIGAIGSPDDGKTAEELSKYRGALIVTTYLPIENQTEPPKPKPVPPEPVLSTKFKARINWGIGGGEAGGGAYTELEIVDITNLRLMKGYYGGIGATGGLPISISGIDGPSDWQDISTNVPIQVEDFQGPVAHFVGGLSFFVGPIYETYILQGPMFTNLNNDYAYIRFKGLRESGNLLIGAAIDYGVLKATGKIDKVLENYYKEP